MNAVSGTLAPRYDPLAADILADPYPVYARLRRSGPLCRGGPGQWVATHYSDVAALLASPALGSEYPAPYHAFSLGSGSASLFYQRIVLYRDPPAHGPLRALLRQAMKPALIGTLGSRLPAIIDGLLQPALDGARFDLLDHLAISLSFRVLSELIGFPDTDLQEVRRRAMDLSKAFGTRIAAVDRSAVDAAVDWLRDYVGTLLDERRRAPRDDVLSQIARTEDVGGLTREDKIDNVAFLLFAGFETTGNLMGNGLAALLDSPQEWSRLRARRELVASAAEELLRYDPPIQGVARAVRETIAVGGRLIRQGRVLILLIGSANHDESRFPDPQRLDIARNPNPHLSFGGGIHHCLGASLARLELTAMLSRLLETTSSIVPSGPAVRRTDTRFRCYGSLPVSVRAA